jgi:hypothetical protein
MRSGNGVSGRSSALQIDGRAGKLESVLAAAPGVARAGRDLRNKGACPAALASIMDFQDVQRRQKTPKRRIVKIDPRRVNKLRLAASKPGESFIFSFHG